MSHPVKAFRDKAQKLGLPLPGSPMQWLALGILLVLLAAVAFPFSTSWGGVMTSHPHEAQRALLGEAKLHLCQVELEQAKAGQIVGQCEQDLKKTRASLAAALGVSVGGVSGEAISDGSCPPCNCPSTKCPSCPAQPAPATCPPCAEAPLTQCPSCPSCPSCPQQALSGALPSSVDSLQWRSVDAMDTSALKAEIADLRDMAKRLISEKVRLENQLKGSASWDDKAVSKDAMDSAKRLLGDCNVPVAPASSGDCKNITAWKGYECKASDAELQRYLDYTPRALCPQDWYFAQKLKYMKDCFALPRRRCLSVTPPQPEEPLPFPQSLFDPNALKDANVRWDLHQCKSFGCLNSRQIGDCRNCFNLKLEERRWKSKYRGSIKMADVIAMKNGGLRLGLDAGGGTGSFAAHMARYNVTVLTTAFNVETVPGRKGGLPYMEAIALRGLVPLHVPHKERLPLYDGTLDVVHSVNSIKYLPPLEFEELLFEWDRVLRVGGILWFEMFYAPVSEMPVYVQLIELLGYKKLYWNYTPKPDAGEREGEHVYLNCVIEKPPRPGNEVLDGPPDIDTKDMI